MRVRVLEASLLIERSRIDELVKRLDQAAVVVRELRAAVRDLPAMREGVLR
jgi:hypothetical protein